MRGEQAQCLLRGESEARMERQAPALAAAPLATDGLRVGAVERQVDLVPGKDLQEAGAFVIGAHRANPLHVHTRVVQSPGMIAPEYLPVCDETNRVIGRASRAVVHAQGLRHRAVHVVLLNSKGEIFLQRRGPQKDTFPGVWDTSVGGHVLPGEEFDEAAARELAEELGIEGQPTRIGDHPACEETGMEFVAVYELVTDQPPRWDGIEVADGQWMSPPAIAVGLADGSLSATPAFCRTFELWRRMRGR